MSARHRRLAVLLVSLLLPALGAGCVGVPSSGPVVEVDDAAGTADDATFQYRPGPPRPGELPDEIVRNFLEAMTAVPIQTSVAREFLTVESQGTWDPEQSTLVYAEANQPRAAAGTVTVTLQDAYRLDSRGAFEGELAATEQPLRFSLLSEDGEWRISDPPNALIVRQTWADDNFRRAEVYYFDPTAQILVPEPVRVPAGDSFLTALVRSLLAGSAPGQDVSRTFLPSGSSDMVVEVQNGVAAVDLPAGASALSEQEARLAAVQVAWTLRQDPSIRAFRLTADGVPLAGLSGALPVGQGLEYDPADFGATGRIFGLRDGVLVAGSVEDLSPVGGRVGRRDFGFEDFAVSLDGQQVAGVTGGRTSVLLGPTEDPAGGVREIVGGAASLLRPRWDAGGRLWLVDRTVNGARITLVAGERPVPLSADGITGTDVRRFLVSRDGSRFVAQVRRDGRDLLVVSRIRRDERGRVLGLTPAQTLPWQGDVRPRVRDLAWRTPTSLSVLYPVRDLVQIREVPVDGSPPGLQTSSPTLLGSFRWLSGSPVPDEPLYAGSVDGLVDLAGTDRGALDVGLDPGTTTYAG